MDLPQNKYVRLSGLAILLFLAGSCNTNTYMGRWMTWRSSDVGDFEKFPSYPFHASPDPFRYVYLPDAQLSNLPVPESKGRNKPLDILLRETETTAFLVIRRDTLLYEQYFNGYTRESVNTSFSVAKSITSLLVGCALGDGLVSHTGQVVTDYLPGCPQFSHVTLADLLDMRSGIQFKDHDMPWGDKPKAYYDPDLRGRIQELEMSYTPGTRFQYNSYNPIIAGMVLEKASGKSPARYFEERVWDRMGMEFSGSWSLDSEASGMTKMESGLNLRAIDFVKFGSLVLHRGRWNGSQIIPESWILDIMDCPSVNQVSEFGSDVHYEKFWWLFRNETRGTYILSGWGHLGQYLYIFPDSKVIIARMGKSTGSVDSWKAIFTEVENFVAR